MGPFRVQPACLSGGWHAGQGECLKTLPEAGSVVETHFWAETGAERSFSAKQPFPQLQAGAVTLHGETKALPGPFFSFASELCSGMGPGQQTPPGD